MKFPFIPIGIAFKGYVTGIFPCNHMIMSLVLKPYVIPSWCHRVLTTHMHLHSYGWHKSMISNNISLIPCFCLLLTPKDRNLLYGAVLFVVQPPITMAFHCLLYHLLGLVQLSLVKGTEKD